MILLYSFGEIALTILVVVISIVYLLGDQLVSLFKKSEKQIEDDDKINWDI